MHVFISAVLSLLLLSPTASPSPAPSTPVEIAQSRIDTMLKSGHADPAWFSESFLAQVPASKVDEIVADLTKTLGAYSSVEFTPTRFLAHFAKGTDDVLIRLDADNKIIMLFFRPPVIASASLDDALHDFGLTHGTLSYVISAEGRSERAALNASVPLAVGSAFKLAVLNALADQIAHGKRRWSDAVALREQWKSLPSGVLQTWPAGTPITIATYAAEMISISDNTAADALAALVGFQSLKPYAGTNVPFLTTREMFVLKSSTGAKLRGDYTAAKTSAARMAVLRRADVAPLPDLSDLQSDPNLAIEWHYSVRELCAMMRRVADLPLMSINPGVANRSDFRRVAYKGGSDLGVLNMTTLVTTRRGAHICFSATVNNGEKGVDEAAFAAHYGAVLRTLQ